jgi:hypothetical protein
MRTTILFASILALTAGNVLAQEGKYSQTLDEQLARVKAGKTAIPAAGEPASAPAAAPAMTTAPAITPAEAPAAAAPERKPLPKMARPAARQEWPAQPAAASPAAGNATAAAPAMYRDRKGEVIDSVGGGAIPALPLTVMTNGGFKYVTGGVGEEELAQLKGAANDFNAQILLAGADGEFVGDALVDITGADGAKILSADNAGPYFYASLPPGSYRLNVTVQGVAKTASFNVPAKGIVKPVVRF